MRHWMVDPDNEERLLKVPPHVVKRIKAEAFAEASNHKQYYMTAEEFFACLQDAWVQQHDNDVINEWHPEDLAEAISSLAEGVGFFMSTLIKMRGKQ